MRSSILVISIAGLLGACANTASLKPAPWATTQPTSESTTAAVDMVSGVHVSVIPRDWPGSARISEEVTPLKVRIQNTSNDRVMVRYSEIRLVAPDGSTYAALPPYSIEGTVSDPQVTRGGRPVGRRFPGTGFAVSPMYSPLYPGFPVAGTSFPHDPLYYSHYGSFWRTADLPTNAMLELALPEGVLDPGGSVQGYLYFEKVDPDVPRVRFRMDVVNAGRGNEIGMIEIPFVVS